MVNVQLSETITKSNSFISSGISNIEWNRCVYIPKEFTYTSRKVLRQTLLYVRSHGSNIQIDLLHAKRVFSERKKEISIDIYVEEDRTVHS